MSGRLKRKTNNQTIKQQQQQRTLEKKKKIHIKCVIINRIELTKKELKTNLRKNRWSQKLFLRSNLMKYILFVFLLLLFFILNNSNNREANL